MLIRGFHIYVITVLFFFLYSCNQDEGHNGVNGTAYKSTVTEGVSKEVNQVQFNVKHMPATVKLKRMYPEGRYSNADSLNACAFQDFLIRVSKPGWKPLKDTTEHMNFKMAGDFRLIVNGKDTIKSSICEHIVSGTADYHEFIVSFETGNIAKENNLNWQLLYNDKVFGAGYLMFNIPNELNKR